MKVWSTITAIAVPLLMLAAIVYGVIVYGVRSFSSAVTPIKVTKVAEGVSCASMVTSDGAAISCWKD